MGTSTGNSDTPLRRSLVWSHNTSYTGAAGLHTETSKRADAIQVSSQRELKGSVSSLQAAHSKQLRALQQHRKSLETSMLAYTEKMRRISTERLQPAPKASGRTPDEKAPHHHHGGGGGGSFDRLLMASTDSVGAASSGDSRSKVSADSGVDVTLAGDDVIRKSSSNKNLLVAPVMTSLADTTGKPRPSSSFHDDVNATKAVTARPGDGDRASPSNESRRRRAGTSQQPDVFALKLSMHRDSPEEDAQPSSDSQQDPSAADDIAVPPLAIMPFPESAATSSRIRVDESGILIHPQEDSDRASETSSRISLSSTKKLMKTKDNYWSYRSGRSPHRLSLQLPQPPHAAQGKKKKRNSIASEPPTPSPRHRPTPRPRRSTKTYHTSFRYSLAVEDVMQSLEDCPGTAVARRTIGTVSQSLPALDVQDLRVERQQRQSLERSARERRAESVTSSFSTSTTQHQHDHDSGVDGADANAEYPGNEDDVAREFGDGVAAVDLSDGDYEEGVHTPLAALCRERSRSAPDFLHPLQREECEGEAEEGVSLEEGSPPVLKNSSGSGTGAFDSDLSDSSRAGDVRLPPLYQQTAEE